MAKKVKKLTQVLLRQDVKGFGQRGEVKQAAAGYARNFLFPKKVAVEATPHILAQLKVASERKVTKAAGAKADAQRVADSLAGKTVTIRAKAGEKGKLFGSISARDLVGAIKDQLGVMLDAKALDLPEPIKQLGKHEVKVKLAPDVSGTVAIQIVSTKG